MNIIYIHPNGFENPHLFPAFKKTFAENGHTETSVWNEASHCFIELISGQPKYESNILNLIMERRIPIIRFDNREFGSMNTEKWLPPTYEYPFIHFVRNMNKEEQYPDNVFPFDWAYFPQCDFEPVSKEELFSRPYDLCFTGTESPARKNVIKGIKKDGRLNPIWEFRDHTQRIFYNQWINEHRQAKLYVECEGGGFTSERHLQLFAVAPMLKVMSNHLAENIFEDGINCLTISEHPTDEEIEKIKDIIEDKDWLYDIYMAGIKFTKENLSAESRADYVLKTINEYSNI